TRRERDLTRYSGRTAVVACSTIWLRVPSSLSQSHGAMQPRRSRTNPCRAWPIRGLPPVWLTARAFDGPAAGSEKCLTRVWVRAAGTCRVGPVFADAEWRYADIHGDCR